MQEGYNHWKDIASLLTEIYKVKKNKYLLLVDRQNT